MGSLASYRFTSATLEVLARQQLWKGDESLRSDPFEALRKGDSMAVQKCVEISIHSEYMCLIYLYS